MTWQYWLLVSLLLAILSGLAGLAWMVWLQNRAISILRADLLSTKGQVVQSEKSLLEALRTQGEHYQGVIEYLREQIARSNIERDAHAEAAASARDELDQAQREAKKFAAILARKERREPR